MNISRHTYQDIAYLRQLLGSAADSSKLAQESFEKVRDGADGLDSECDGLHSLGLDAGSDTYQTDVSAVGRQLMSGADVAIGQLDSIEGREQDGRGARTQSVSLLEEAQAVLKRLDEVPALQASLGYDLRAALSSAGDGSWSQKRLKESLDAAEGALHNVHNCGSYVAGDEPQQGDWGGADVSSSGWDAASAASNAGSALLNVFSHAGQLSDTQANVTKSTHEALQEIEAFLGSPGDSEPVEIPPSMEPVAPPQPTTPASATPIWLREDAPEEVRAFRDLWNQVAEETRNDRLRIQEG